MGRIDCRAAEVREIPHMRPAYLRYADERSRVSRLAQEPIYRKFMDAATYERFRSEKPGAYTATWDEGGLPARFYNAYVGKTVVAVADLKTQHDRWTGWMIVEPIYFIPDCQGKGVGHQLWDECVKDAKKAAAPGVHVCSLTQNEVARRFYAHTLRLPVVSNDELLTIGDKKFQAERYELRF